MGVNTTDISLIPYDKLETYILNYLFIAELSPSQLLYFLILILYFFIKQMNQSEIEIRCYICFFFTVAGMF